MRSIIKAVSLSLCIVLACPLLLSGCSSEGKDKYVSEDSPWYSLKQFKVCEQYETDDSIDFYQTDIVGSDDEYLYYMTAGFYEVPYDVDYSTIDFNEYKFTFMDIYDMSGNLYRTVDLKEAITSSGKLPSDAIDWVMGNPDNFYIIDGSVNMLLTAVLFPSGEDNTYKVVYDLTSDSVASIELAIEDGNSSSIYSDSDNGLYRFDGYIVQTFTRYDTDSPCYMLVTEPDGTEHNYRTDVLMPDTKTVAISEVISLGGSDVIVGLWNPNYITKTYFKMDLHDGSVEPYNDDTSWFSNYFTSCSATYFDDVGYVVADNTGIKKLDFDNHKVVDQFSFDSCNINRYDAKDLDIISMSDDTIVLSGAFYRSNGYGRSTMDVNAYVLTREEVNPNAGKKILYAATMTEFDYTFCEAVRSFNETNPDYYMAFDTQYSLREMYLAGEIDTYKDGFDSTALEAQTELSNKLAVDLMAGDGPDIIVDGASLYQLNRDDYLLDLSSCIDKTGLFTNVIDAAMVDGKLYQVPLTFGVNGVIVRASDLGEGQTGFTFDQYDAFIDSVCNGTDPVELGKCDYFACCLTALNNECISGNTVNYSNDTVVSLAGFVNDNVFDPAVDIEDQVYDFYRSEPSGLSGGGKYEQGICFGTLLFDYTLDIENITVAGLPSPDGRGPMLSVDSSVGISASTEDPDACIAFVRTLLSEDIQNDYGRNNNGIPVRVSSFEDSSSELLERKNEDITDYLVFMETYGLHDDTVPHEEISLDVISSFEDMIASCSSVAALDPAVMIIVKEEIAAYFEGQKPLPEVLSLIENRVQTFVDERG